jgi:hypothetical protein
MPPTQDVFIMAPGNNLAKGLPRLLLGRYGNTNFVRQRF